MSEHPTWQPIPAPLPVYDKPAVEECRDCERMATNPYHYHDGEWGRCEFCCPICQDERIAAAARAALDDMTTVLRYWTFESISPLTGVRALVALLIKDARNER